MTIARGKIHKYLGMTMKYTQPGEVILSIVGFIGNMFNETIECIRGELATPAAHDLFDITKDATKLS